MNFTTSNGRIVFNRDHFDFYLNQNNCKCGECEWCTDDNVTCSVKVINGQVADIKSGETFREIIYNYFEECCYESRSNEYGISREYEKYFQVFEQFVIDNHKPTGRFTKPAAH